MRLPRGCISLVLSGGTLQVLMLARTFLESDCRVTLNTSFCLDPEMLKSVFLNSVSHAQHDTEDPSPPLRGWPSRETRGIGAAQ